MAIPPRSDFVRHVTTPLLAVTLAALATAQTRPVATGPDPRPRLAVVGFESVSGADERDAWIPVAVEEVLARRLRYVPGLIVAPSVRLYPARQELADPTAPPPSWERVARGLGLHYQVSGTCAGHDAAVTLHLTLRRLDQDGAAARETEIPTQRLFDALDAATRWILAQFDLAALEPALAERVLAPPARSATVLEYHARALQATRADNPRDALRYATQAVHHDAAFRPALALLAQAELQLGPSGRGAAARRLRALSELATRENDWHDRIRAEISLALFSQADGAFDAAYTRAANALTWAFEQRDLYGQLAALTAIADAFLLRPAPTGAGLPAAALERFARQNLREAAEWQAALVEQLEQYGDLIAAMPALNKLGLIYERLDQPEDASRMHRRTLELAERLGSRRHQATAWLYLGQWYRRLQRWPDALDATTRCLALADDSAQPAVRIALGGIYQAMELHEEALAQFERAYEQVRRDEDLMTQFTCLREIATARMKLGRRDKALLALQEAIDLAHVLELRDEKLLREELERWKRGDG